jgi:hypothetical protein
MAVGWLPLGKPQKCLEISGLLPCAVPVHWRKSSRRKLKSFVFAKV